VGWRFCTLKSFPNFQRDGFDCGDEEGDRKNGIPHIRINLVFKKRVSFKQKVIDWVKRLKPNHC
jgi:hypothetical protein